MFQTKFTLALLALSGTLGLSHAFAAEPAQQAKGFDKAEPAERDLRQTPATQLPAALAGVGESAENVYDFVMADQWQQAQDKLSALHQDLAALPSTVPNSGVTQLKQTVGQLQQSLAAKNKLNALAEANQLTRQVAELSRQYRNKAPVEAVLLDYQGRELQIWSQAGDLSKLNARSKDIVATWNKLKPQVLAHGGKAQAAVFSQLVDQVKQARTLAQYAAAAGPFLEAVDGLEKVFGA